MSTTLSGPELYKYPLGSAKDRAPIFLKKYTNNESFELVTGQKVVFITDKTIVDAVKKRQDTKNLILIDKKKNTYKFTQLKKTEEFGSTSGTGAGSKNTSLNESAQALYAAARWNKTKTYDTKDLTKAYTKCDISESLNDILKNLPGDWIISSKAGAEKLYEEFGSGKNYKFHRQSSWVKKLENHFLKLNKENKEFSDVNKWTPADIYLISPAGERVDFSKTTSIIELNNILKLNLTSKDIVGVSLKKIEKLPVKFDYYNFGKQKPPVKYTGYNVGKKAFFRSKDVSIKFTVDGEIGFRTFQVAPSSFAGEINGKFAQQGKISYGPCYKIIEKISKTRRLTNATTVKSLFDKGDADILKTFYKYYTKLSNDSPKLDYEDFIKEYNLKGPDKTSWAYSKYLGCELIDIIIEEKIEDNFIGKAVQYASSQSDLSAPYVKIE